MDFSQLFKNQLINLAQQYNGEHDIHDDGLIVSYTEKILIDVTLSMLDEIERLTNRVRDLEMIKTITPTQDG